MRAVLGLRSAHRQLPLGEVRPAQTSVARRCMPACPATECTQCHVLRQLVSTGARLVRTLGQLFKPTAECTMPSGTMLQCRKTPPRPVSDPRSEVRDARKALSARVRHVAHFARDRGAQKPVPVRQLRRLPTGDGALARSYWRGARAGKPQPPYGRPVALALFGTC